MKVWIWVWGLDLVLDLGMDLDLGLNQENRRPQFKNEQIRREGRTF